jgi:hypothetical protein
MKQLERMVADTLEKEGLCIVPEEHLRRVWPDDTDRHVQVARFADKHAWMLFSYSDYQGAIFARVRGPRTKCKAGKP